ncbi:YceK/YidQ family lipoprotein [Salmonella enterica]|nr:YceK/YidQ family lipoprotein [Salmonella enterica]
MSNTPYHILDLPFSLIFDTLLLPLDIHHGPYE